MNVSSEYPVMVFKNTYNDKDYYTLGMGKKNQDGTYTNGYMPCQFRKGVNIDNQTNIYLKEAWLNFYLKDNKTMPFVFINEYQLVADAIKETSYTSLKQNEISIDLDDLPF